MNIAISVTKPPKISFKYVLLLVGILTALFLLSNLITVKEVANNSPDFTTEDLAEIAEEIYSAGDISEAVKNLPIESAALAKMISEIERILRKTTDYPGCEVYLLEVEYAGNYPILEYGNILSGYVYLREGEAWKVGKTCKGEEGRYPSGVFFNNKDLSIELNDDDLFYNKIFEGTLKQALIFEKLMIYSYPVWSGHPDLLKPPGCKIYR